MIKTSYQEKSGHIVVQVIKSFISKLRQNPDVYPIRYYKKNRRFRGNAERRLVK
ncbi:MAG: hypothetical protein JNM14_02175 [Ferruginibacter sp.]|nr:hypothetical protein [Ferruginibacter sp.]